MPIGDAYSTNTDFIYKVLAKKLVEQSGCACGDIPEDVWQYRVSARSTPFKRNDYRAMKHIFHRLPVAQNVAKTTVRYIFSNGLTTGENEKQNQKLKTFLYGKNIDGDTNLSILESAIEYAFVYGRCGIRVLNAKDGILLVKPWKYATVQDVHKEYQDVMKVVAYIIGSNAYDVKLETLDLLKMEQTKNTSSYYDPESKTSIVFADKFINVRNDLSTIYGSSPLYKEQDRLQTILRIYDRIHHDVSYDGTGRVVVKLKEMSDILSVENEGFLTNDAERERLEQQVITFANELKRSSSDDVVILPQMLEIAQALPRTTKMDDFKYFLENEGQIICDMFSVSAILFGYGKRAGNISMQGILDNTMLNTIVPLREHYAMQLSAYLAPLLGVEKIYFDKYELQENISESGNTITYKGVDYYKKETVENNGGNE